MPSPSLIPISLFCQLHVFCSLNKCFFFFFSSFIWLLDFSLAFDIVCCVWGNWVLKWVCLFILLNWNLIGDAPEITISGEVCFGILGWFLFRPGFYFLNCGSMQCHCIKSLLVVSWRICLLLLVACQKDNFLSRIST